MNANRKILIGFIVSCFMLTGCTNKEEKEKTAELTPDGTHFNHQMIENTAIEKQEDGWYYYISIQYNKIDRSSEEIKGNMIDSPDYVVFNGDNLKYKSLENVYAPVIDIKTGKEINRGTVNMPSLSTLQTVSAEVKKINDYFLDKKFKDAIQESDLDDLDCPSFDKAMLVKLYNEALANTPESFGRFANLPGKNLVQIKSEDRTTWQGAYMSGYGDIAVIEFECIKDEKYMSDLVENDTATETEKNLQENLDQLEEHIIETQVFSIDGITWKHPEVMDDTTKQAINAVLKKLYTGAKDI